MLESKTLMPWRGAGNQHNYAQEIRNQNMCEFTLFKCKKIVRRFTELVKIDCLH